MQNFVARMVEKTRHGFAVQRDADVILWIVASADDSLSCDAKCVFQKLGLEHGNDPSEGVFGGFFPVRQMGEFPEPFRIRFREKSEPGEGRDPANRAHEHDEKDVLQAKFDLVLHPRVHRFDFSVDFDDAFIKPVIFHDETFFSNWVRNVFLIIFRPDFGFHFVHFTQFARQPCWRKGVRRSRSERSGENFTGDYRQKVRRGCVVYTDKYKVYDSLMCCGYRHLNVDYSSRFCVGKVYINGLEGFWSWAKERLFKHYGASAKNFPLYLKELEFRYNHREESIFEPLVRYLSDLVPELPPPRRWLRVPNGRFESPELCILNLVWINLVQILSNHLKLLRKVSFAPAPP